MKHILFNFFISLIFCSGYAQPYNNGHHFGIDRTGNMMAINSRAYYFSTEETGCCSKNTVLRGWNNSQSVMTTTITHPGLFWDYPKKLIMTADKQLLLFGYSMPACDVGGLRDYIVKIDTLGNVVFHTYVQAMNNPYPMGQIVDAVTYTDGSFYLVSKDSLFHYSSAGSFLSKISAGMNNINSLFVLANGNLLVNGMVAGILRNVELTVNAGLVNQQTCNLAINKFAQTANGQLVARTSALGLEVYTSSLSLVTASASANLPGPVNDFLTRNDSIFMTGNNSLNPIYAILNQSLATLYQTQSTYKGIQPTGIAITNKNRIAIISTCASSVQQNITFKGYYQLPITGTFASVSDAGVTGFSLTTYNYSSQASTPGSSYIVYPEYNLGVLVKNFSATDTVHDFYLNYSFNQNGCIKLFHKKYTTTIAPLGSVTVATGLFQAPSFTVPANAQASDTYYQQLCFFTTVPNASNDIEINNDAACDSVMISNLALGINDNKATSARISVFPNPFSGQLNIHSDLEVQNYQVVNLLGTAVLEGKPANKNTAVDFSGLPNGVYLIHLQTEKGAYIKKVVKH